MALSLVHGSSMPIPILCINGCIVLGNLVIRYKENKSPWQLAQEKMPDIRKEGLMIQPVDLRWPLKKKMDFQTSGVYDVFSCPYFQLSFENFTHLMLYPRRNLFLWGVHNQGSVSDNTQP